MSEKISPIIGHESAQEQLSSLMKQGKLPHAILLSGPRGIGKAALADTISRCLLTGEAEAEEAGGLFGEALPTDAPARLSYDLEHPAIARMEAGGHGNIKLVEPLRDEKKKMSFTTINIEQVRSVIDFMHLSTSEAGWRVVIIDPADGLNRNAENALLKVLEEPPEKTLLMLVTHKPDKLLPTTRSRCREVKLQPPTTQQVVEILANQKVNVSLEQQEWLMQLAPISAGQWDRYLKFEAENIYYEWLELLVDSDSASIQSLATKFAKLEPEAWQMAGDLLLCVLHRLALYAQGQLELLPREEETIPALTQRYDASHWFAVWQQAVEWWPQTTGGNYDKKQVLQSLLFQASSGAKNAA